MNNKKLVDFFIKKNLESNSEVILAILDDKKYWIKKRRDTKSSKLHKFYYRIFPFDILIPVKEKNGIEAMNYEINKLKKFQSYGLNTPNVIFNNNDFFVLEDCGRTINSFIRKKDISENMIYFYVDKMLLELSKIHNNLDFHGGPQARNFTFFNEKIYVIDLEDSFDDSINLKILQFRDLFLFLLSLTKIRDSINFNYEYTINKYINLTNNIEFKFKLSRFANYFSFFIFIGKIKFINKILGRDIRGVLKLFESLKNL